MWDPSIREETGPLCQPGPAHLQRKSEKELTLQRLASDRSIHAAWGTVPRHLCVGEDGLGNPFLVPGNGIPWQISQAPLSESP